MFLIFYFTPIITNTFLNMENAENEENNTTNHVTPPPSTHHSRVVYIVCTLCICVHISSGQGLEKDFYIQILKRILAIKKSGTFFSLIL